MPSRRSHTKSRHGCLRCKQKRVKCDEVRPVCGACLKHGAACEFGDLTATKKMSLSHIVSSHPQTHVSISTPPSTSTATPSPGRAQSEMPRPPMPLPPLRQPGADYAMNLRDLELLHNFMQHVTPTLTEVPHLGELWRGPVMREALKHPFLMHGILALSALHMVLTGAHRAGEIIYRDVAMRQEMAMNIYRSELNNITEDNCHALFLFSSIVSLNAFAFPRLPGPMKDPDTVMKELIDILVFIKSITILLDSTNTWLRRGPVAALLRLDVMEKCVPLTDDQNRMIDDLNHRNEHSNDAPSVKSTNSAAIKAVETAFTLQWDTTSRPFLWPCFIGDDFHALLRQRHPMSLCILAHYGVLMAACDERWWSQGWGREAVSSVAHVIQRDWVPALGYPLYQLGLPLPHGHPEG